MGSNQVLGGGGIHHVALRSSDFEASYKFYTEALGCKETFGWGEGDKRIVLLDTGDGSYIELFAGGTAEQKPEGLYFHLALRCTNVDAAVERAVSAGATVTIPPKDVELGGEALVRIAFLKGLDGEVIEFFHSKGGKQL